MIKEATTQEKVDVGIEALWRALAKDMRFIIPKIIPNLVRDVEVIEGDGGLGTVFLFNFGSDVSTVRCQKEKIVELDESLHQIGLQVIEGGHLRLGFSWYKTSFKLTSVGEHETLVDLKVAYETETEETPMPAQTTKSALAFIKCLENYLQNGAV
ncbi:hypothetical protein L1049_001318 [Liquidambar formosana]|uniref:Bet v I/Major latex protein domain-containing protein n=1 Tax=Liquidambar formosana TaxID=63359 RepID=A0AAP0NC84_LIQFO